MGWHIAVAKNDLVVSSEFQERLEEAADNNGHSIFFDENVIEFDYDAMEHMDFMDEPWATEILSEAKANGTVIFSSSEGDNAGGYWGYQYTDGMVTELSKKQCLEALLADMA